MVLLILLNKIRPCILMYVSKIITTFSFLIYNYPHFIIKGEISCDTLNIE